MNTKTLEALRTVSNHGDWNVVSDKGRIIMFGLSEDRAVAMAKTVAGAKAETAVTRGNYTVRMNGKATPHTFITGIAALHHARTMPMFEGDTVAIWCGDVVIEPHVVSIANPFSMQVSA